LCFQQVVYSCFFKLSCALTAFTALFVIFAAFAVFLISGYWNIEALPLHKFLQVVSRIGASKSGAVEFFQDVGPLLWNCFLDAVGAELFVRQLLLP
jgi:hypothetical protein